MLLLDCAGNDLRQQQLHLRTVAAATTTATVAAASTAAAAAAAAAAGSPRALWPPGVSAAVHIGGRRPSCRAELCRRCGGMPVSEGLHSCKHLQHCDMPSGAPRRDGRQGAQLPRLGDQ